MNHRWLESRMTWMAVLTTATIMVGTIVELVPLYTVQSTVPRIAEVKPYTPLELEGRDIYIREGCYTCHSQAVRPFRDETERYGPYSTAGEFVYDRPVQWGSKRTGPDLHRLGGKYPDSWHWLHMIDPRSMSPESIMPNYPWLVQKLDTSLTFQKMVSLRAVGTPYTDEEILGSGDALRAQAKQIGDRLRADGIENVDDEAELVALIAYLQRLGTDIGWREQQ
jgi:cytochrome c oxidase cbb3-type subunit I/II